MAQIIVAIQMVTEQKFVLQYDIPPLLAVGCEGETIHKAFLILWSGLGLFGLLTISLAMIPMYFIHVTPTFSKNPFYRLEDVLFALRQIHAQPIIAVALLLTIIRYFLEFWFTHF